MLEGMLTGMHPPLPNKQTHHAKVMPLDIKRLCLDVKYLDVKICGLMSRYVVCRCARERMGRGGGGVEMWMCAVVGIHIPPYKKTKMDLREPRQ